MTAAAYPSLSVLKVIVCTPFQLDTSITLLIPEVCKPELKAKLYNAWNSCGLLPTIAFTIPSLTKSAKACRVFALTCISILELSNLLKASFILVMLLVISPLSASIISLILSKFSFKVS